MLLRMLKENMPIDEIIFCDTYKEFPQMYQHIEKVNQYIKKNYDKEITIIKAPKSYDYYMFEHKKTRGKNRGQMGYSWAEIHTRWCTSLMKTNVIKKYLKEKYKNEIIRHYVGIAYDETRRVKDKCYPLIKWKMTESDCLNYCYNMGFDWEGLYKKFNRVSCWCCPLQSLKELRILRNEFPELWKELQEMDNKTWRRFRADYSVKELEEKFKKEGDKNGR